MPDYYSPLPKGTFSYSGHGVADHGSRKVGNWWSDHATDLMAKALTPVLAVERLTVTSVTRRASTGTGVNDGSTVFATGQSGERYAFLHLDPGMLPVAGQRINAGAPFARIAGGTAGGPHLHFGVEHADPDRFVKAAQEGGGGILDAIGKAGVWAVDTATPAPVGATVDAIGGLGNAVDAVTAVPRLIGRLTDPHYILRGLQLLAGAVLVLLGVTLLARQVALAADVEIPTPARIPLPGSRDLYQRE